MSDKEFHIRSQAEQTECFFPREVQRANLSYFAFASALNEAEERGRMNERQRIAAEKAKAGDAA